MRRNPVPVLLMFHYNFHYLLTSSIWNVTWVVNKKWHLSSKFHITIDFNQGYREVKIKGYNSVHHFCLTHAEPCITSPKLQSLDFFLLISLIPCGMVDSIKYSLLFPLFLSFKLKNWRKFMQFSLPISTTILSAYIKLSKEVCYWQVIYRFILRNLA